MAAPKQKHCCGERRMIKGDKELTKRLYYENEAPNNRQDFINNSIRIVADHFGVRIGDVEWRVFRKPGYHIDPPGRFFIKGEPLKLHLLLPKEEEREE